MEWPMFYEGNPVVLEPNMVFFLHMILMDSATGTAMSLGRSSRVTDGAPEPLSAHPLELLTC
jgi:Xaa-Pro dipeptidase